MKTYFEGGVYIEWSRDYRLFSEFFESVWVKLAEQITFNNILRKIFNLDYTNFQCENVIYFEMMTESKINHPIKTIQSDQNKR